MDILKLIQERKSSRGHFVSERTVAEEDLRQILEAARWAPTAHNMQNFEIVVVDDPKLLTAIGEIKYQVSAAFIQENYQQLSFSEEELLKKKVGILGTMFPLSWRTPGVTPSESEKVNTGLGRIIQTSNILLILVYDPGKRAPASERDFLGIVSLGCVLENMWLTASALGIGFHVVSSISSETVEKEVKSLLKIPEHLKIAFSVRLGYPASSSAYLRVRREVQDFTYHNQYERKSRG